MQVQSRRLRLFSFQSSASKIVKASSLILLSAIAITHSIVAADKREVTIFSDGTRMTGDLYMPQKIEPGAKLPAVIFCNGTRGTRKGPPERLAAIFVEHGFAFLAFDYRGWGDSDSPLMSLEKQPKPDETGEMTLRVRAMRWQMNYADQTADIRAAIRFLSAEPNIDPQRIGLLGTSYGGGLVTWVAGNDPRVKCVVAQVPGMGGIRTEAGAKAAYELQTKQARSETEPVPYETGKLGGQLARYGQMRTNPAKNIGYSASEAAQKIGVPMLVIDAEQEELIDVKQNGQKVAEILQGRGITVKHHVIKGISHYGVYREAFDEASKLEIEWFQEYLAPGTPRGK